MSARTRFMCNFLHPITLTAVNRIKSAPVRVYQPLTGLACRLDGLSATLGIISDNHL